MDSFIYERDDQTEIFRVFKIEQLRMWLQNSQLYFPRPQQWEDPFENILVRQKYHRAGTDITLDFSDVLDRYVGQCWSRAPQETDATWRIYAPEGNGARVGITVEKMYSALDQAFGPDAAADFKICRVDYFPAGAITKKARLVMECLEAVNDPTGEERLTLLTVKRPEFEHEAEVRVIYHDTKGHLPAGATHILIPVDPLTTITSVTLDPRLKSSEFADLKGEFDAILAPMEIVQSQLYRLDTVSIPVYTL